MADEEKLIEGGGTTAAAANEAETEAAGLMEAVMAEVNRRTPTDEEETLQKEEAKEEGDKEEEEGKDDPIPLEEITPAEVLDQTPNNEDEKQGEEKQPVEESKGEEDIKPADKEESPPKEKEEEPKKKDKKEKKGGKDAEEPLVVKHLLTEEEIMAKGVSELEVENYRKFYLRQAFSPNKWYEAVEEHTFPTEFLTLNSDEVEALIASCHSTSEDIPTLSDKDQRIFNQLKEKLDECISKYGDVGAMVQLNTKLPTDAILEKNNGDYLQFIQEGVATEMEIENQFANAYLIWRSWRSHSFRETETRTRGDNVLRRSFRRIQKTLRPTSTPTGGRQRSKSETGGSADPLVEEIPKDDKKDDTPVEQPAEEAPSTSENTPLTVEATVETQINPQITDVVTDEPQPTESESQPTKPESQPAEPESQPTELESQPTEPESQPAEPESQPAEPESQPAEPESQPAESETQSAKPESQPRESQPESKPTESESQPESQPTESESQPEVQPTESESQPESHPTESESQPAEPESQPNEQAPTDSEIEVAEDKTAKDSGERKSKPRSVLKKKAEGAEPSSEEHQLIKVKKETFQNKILRAYMKTMFKQYRVTNGTEALNLITTSAIMKEELQQVQTFETIEGTEAVLSVIKWSPTDMASYPGMNFRAFVYKNVLTAVTQHDDILYVPNIARFKDTILKKIETFFNTVLKEAFESEANYVVDLFVAPNKVYVTRLHPFHHSTGACLYTWRQSQKLLMNGPVELRHVPTPFKRCFTGLLPHWETVCMAVCQQKREEESANSKQCVIL